MSRAKSGGISVVAEILQKEVTASRALNATDNKHTLFLNSAAALTITVNNDLPDNFECEFVAKGVGQTTFEAGTATLSTTNGTKLDQSNVASVVKFLTNNDYWLLGELTL